MTEILPDELQYGFVADRIVRAVGDTDKDDDRHPDGVPGKGTVEFTPLSNIRYSTDRPPTRVSLATITCKYYEGDDPDAPDYNPHRAGMIVDPAGYIGNVALVVGDYKVDTQLEDGHFQTFDITVKPEHTKDKPLWLANEAEQTPSTYERFVVNEQVYTDTLAARDKAKEYRDAARSARSVANGRATDAAESASEAKTTPTVPRLR